MATFEYANADDLVAVKPIVEEHFPDVKEGQARAPGVRHSMY